MACRTPQTPAPAMKLALRAGDDVYLGMVTRDRQRLRPLWSESGRWLEGHHGVGFTAYFVESDFFSLASHA